MFHYYNIDVRITIAESIEFRFIKSIRIESTIERFSDIAKIEVPREFKYAKQDQGNLSIANKNLLDFIKVGDSVKIEIGYNGNLETEFKGYLKSIGAEIPLMLECEDEMYKLRRKPAISKTFKAVNLKQLLKFIAPEYNIEALDMPLGKFEISNATPYKVIEELKQQYGVRCYFKNKVLNGGLTVDFKPGTKHLFVFGKNIRKSSSLKYLTTDQRKRFYKAVSIQKGTSKKVTYEFGDKEGDHRSLHLPTNLSLQEVKDWTEKTHNSHVYNGYEGSVHSWGYPKTKAGDSAEIRDPNYKDGHRDITLFISGVTITLDESSGFKRENKLSFKIK